MKVLLISVIIKKIINRYENQKEHSRILLRPAFGRFGNSLRHKEGGVVAHRILVQVEGVVQLVVDAVGDQGAVQEGRHRPYLDVWLGSILMVSRSQENLI